MTPFVNNTFVSCLYSPDVAGFFIRDTRTGITCKITSNGEEARDIALNLTMCEPTKGYCTEEQEQLYDTCSGLYGLASNIPWLLSDLCIILDHYSRDQIVKAIEAMKTAGLVSDSGKGAGYVIHRIVPKQPKEE